MIDKTLYEKNVDEDEFICCKIFFFSDKNNTCTVNASCRIDGPGFDAEIMAKNLDQPNSTTEEILITSIENKCVILGLEVSRRILNSEEALEFAIYDLIKKIIAAGNIDTRIKRSVDLVVICQGQLTPGIRITFYQSLYHCVMVLFLYSCLSLCLCALSACFF